MKPFNAPVGAGGPLPWPAVRTVMSHFTQNLHRALLAGPSQEPPALIAYAVLGLRCVHRPKKAAVRTVLCWRLLHSGGVSVQGSWTSLKLLLRLACVTIESDQLRPTYTPTHTWAICTKTDVRPCTILSIRTGLACRCTATSATWPTFEQVSKQTGFHTGASTVARSLARGRNGGVPPAPCCFFRPSDLKHKRSAHGNDRPEGHV